MRKFKPPIAPPVNVWKTGLPFYDAARLIGAAHRHFGTTDVEVEDEGGRWVLKGPALVQGRRPHHLTWALESLPPYAASAKNLRKAIVDSLEDVASGKGATLQNEDAPDEKQTRRKASSPVYYYLESALQTGIRGPDPLASYRNLASQAGSEFSESVEDVYDAAYGISFAAVSRGRQEEGERRVLPVMSNGNLVLGPFLDFRREYFRHEAGVFVASVWASLAMLEELVGRDLPVADFAFNWVVPRVQSSSGFVGVDRICRLMQKRKENGEDFHFARQVRDYLSGTSSRNADPTEHDLARALARFATTADVKHLETIVRLKARLMALDESGQGRFARGRARRLFASNQVIQEVRDMSEQQVKVPEGMTRALARWFTGGGKDGWIGQFIKLENASSPDRFLDESQRILSRAKMNKESPVDYSPPRGEQEVLDDIRILNGPQFRSLKAVFLLDLQAKMTYGGRRSAAPAQDATETSLEGNNNE